MGKQDQRRLQWIILVPIVLLAVGGLKTNAADSVNVIVRDAPAGVGQQMMEASALGIELVDNSIAVLEHGLEGMSVAQRTHFLRFFDPGATGEADDQFIQNMLVNYRRIRSRMAEPMVIEYESSGRLCVGMRLYYTDFKRVHICPYFLIESSALRMARDYVHEVAHIALLVRDRPFFYPHFSPYVALTPRGHWTAGIPVLGPIFREIALRDTLYHPDAYSKLAESLLCIQLESASELSDGLRCPPHVKAATEDLDSDHAQPDSGVWESRVAAIDPSDLKLLSLVATP